MDSIKVQVKADENGLVTDLLISGNLIIENSQDIHRELIGVGSRLNKSVKITIEQVADIDLTFIQLMMAFRNQMDELKVNYQIFWNLNEDQKVLLDHVGLSNELFMNN